jgi:hypothetical protein
MPRGLVILKNIFLFNKSSSYSDKNYLRLIKQPAIKIAPTHLLRNVGTSVTISLPLFIFFLAVLLLHCTQKVHSSILGTDAKCPVVSYGICLSNSDKSSHNTRCATNRKVAGSIPDGVTEIFHWHKSSGRTRTLGSTQPLTEMRTRNISWW